MPYRPEAELKRPDLKGEFLCGHCGKTFCHAASLNRHRLNFHGDDQQCQLCDEKISPHETVRRHMSTHHGITRVFTCGCCNWTFPDKKELHAHNNSMIRSGHPGDAKAIAISSRAPGSLSQAELKGEERTNTPSTSSTPKSVKKSKRTQQENSASLADVFNALTSASSSIAVGTPIPAEWLQALLLNNPSLLPLLQQKPAPSDSSDNYSDDAGTSSRIDADADDEETTIVEPRNNNNENVEVEEPKQSLSDILLAELQVRTEGSESASSGPESGICSGEDAAECSPSPSESSKEDSPIVNGGDGVHEVMKNMNRKRKSVDAIASLLFKKKLLSE